MEWRDDGSTVVLLVRGRLDVNTSSAFEAELMNGFGGRYQNKTKVTVDFSDTAYVTSAGLRVLLAVHNKMKDKGLTFTITGINPAIREVLDMTGFADYLVIE